MPYAFGVRNQGLDIEEMVRIDKALSIALCNQDSISMFLGAGMERRIRHYGWEFFIPNGKTYLELKGWPSNKIVIGTQGHSTVTETLSLYRHIIDRIEDTKIEVVTSWWHLPRVRIVCRLIFGFRVPIKFHAAPSTHHGVRIMYDIAREIICLPYSLVVALLCA